ncbi:MAG: hypothetical protein B7Z37_23305 [Verrucomicrobia bacterium 12-59-8]|nr:MAG: hypothetical protein B7Z37_23305 [Verrucomicrobia bacterium 12-59-8]
MTNRPKKEAASEASRPSKEELINAVNAATNPEETGVFLGPSADGSEDFMDNEDEVLRVSRSSETRDAESREPATWLPRASLPDPEPEPGWSFRWLRVKVGAQNDLTNVSGRLREGWIVVRPEEQPTIARTLVNGGKGQDSIIIGDSMLAKIPTATVKAREEYYRKQRVAQNAGMSANLLRIQDARMPMLRPSVVSTQSKSPTR